MAEQPTAVQQPRKRQINCLPWLNGTARDVHSQFGEDGLIDAILKKIGVANRWCFEVGAYDGRIHSNVAKLIDEGWNAVLIERDDEQFEKLQQCHAGNDRAQCIHGYVEPATFDGVLQGAGAPEDLDIGVIDIDEQDFWLWAGMRWCQPRIMVVEYGLGRPVDQIPPLRVDRGDPQPVIQAGRNAINYLGVSKGYVSVAVTDCNILFCRADLL